MNKYNILSLLLIGMIFLLSSCLRETTIEFALKQGEKNNIELEKVLRYYENNPSDSLKYKAACFLIENMIQYYYNNKNEAYYPLMDSLYRTDLTLERVYSQFDSLSYFIAPQKQKIEWDIKTLSSEFLINHIDKMFEIWAKSPWSPKPSFEIFCEYILPYAVSSEKRENWADFYRNRYKDFLDIYLAKHTNVLLRDFCEFMVDSLIETKPIRLYQEGLKTYPPLMADNIRSGSCEDYSARTIYAMRALGMPIGIDFSPQWINFHSPHSWNVLVGEDHKYYPFLGFDQSIDDWHIEITFNCTKIFRRTYSIQKNSLAMLGLEKEIPPLFRNLNFHDVSSEYFPVCNVEISLNKKKGIKPKVAYLCVFNNVEWIPVHWGKIEKNTVVFTDMGKGVMYLPAYYTSNGIIPAGEPFILDKTGNTIRIRPSATELETLNLERKYYTIKVDEAHDRILNGEFHGSNDPEFRTYDLLHRIERLPPLVYNTIKTETESKYRYVRYTGTAYRNFCNIAEIEFYSKEGGQKMRLEGEIIGTDNSFADNPNRTKDKVFDGDPLTFFDAPLDSGAWVGLDFKKPARVDEIIYLPRNDDNNIRIGDTYELVYWDNDYWNSLGRKIADSTILTYTKCPKDALFLLHNHTRGKEERIFLYENGKQIFW